MNRLQHKSQKGFSLTEVMVAVTISVILMAGVVEIFASSKATYKIQDNLGRLQENGRFALGFLTKDIRMAGYTGCSSFGPMTNTLKDKDTILYNFNAGIEGYDDVTASPPAYLTASSIDPKVDTDVVIVRRLVDNPIRIVKNNNGAQIFSEESSTIAGGCADGTDKISGLCEGDILMISDCQKSRVFQAGNITVTGTGLDKSANITHPATGTPGNDPSSWGGASLPPDARFGPDAELMKIGFFAYYVKELADGSGALYVFDGSTHSELVGGVEDMQVEYGEDTDGDRTADAYRTAAAVTSWDNIVSARVFLLMRTDNNNLAPSTQTYTFYGSSHTPTDSSDKYLRREFSSTVTLRNRAS